MGPRFDRLRYEVFQNLFLSPMNTGSVRPAVATTPTARGIETQDIFWQFVMLIRCNNTYRSRYWNFSVTENNISFLCLLQQHLPLAVLKRITEATIIINISLRCNNTYRSRYWNDSTMSVLKEYPGARCNNTYRSRYWNAATIIITKPKIKLVATTPTARGIETHFLFSK